LASKALHTLIGMTIQSLTELGDLVADLHPRELADLGLGPALETLALRIERRYGLVVTLDLPPDLAPDVSPLPGLALAAYRIAQEALHNAGQHASAGRVGLSLRLSERDLRLTIADDGIGFRPPRSLNGLTGEDRWGLANMERQATALGGRVEINSVLGVGTQVRATLPLTETSPLPEPSEPLYEPLTPREQEVLRGVTAGLTNKQIAARLGISDRTVQFHLGNVLGKLGVASRTEAAVLALQRGLV